MKNSNPTIGKAERMKQFLVDHWAGILIGVCVLITLISIPLGDNSDVPSITERLQNPDYNDGFFTGIWLSFLFYLLFKD